MTFRTIATYKFSLEDHPTLQANLVDTGRAFAADGKTDGQHTILPVSDTTTEALVIHRDWATIEHAQEWAALWLSTLDAYAATEDGKVIPLEGYTIEVVTV